MKSLDRIPMWKIKRWIRNYSMDPEAQMHQIERLQDELERRFKNRMNYLTERVRRAANDGARHPWAYPVRQPMEGRPC